MVRVYSKVLAIQSVLRVDSILQDYKPIAALERYTPAARVGPDRNTERSDFLREAFRFGIVARSAQRQSLLICRAYTPLYTSTC